jgi:hypothetical protein
MAFTATVTLKTPNVQNFGGIFLLFPARQKKQDDFIEEFQKIANLF